MRRNFDQPPAPPAREATEADLLQLLKIMGVSRSMGFSYFPSDQHLRFSGIFPDATSAKKARQELKDLLHIDMPIYPELERANVVGGGLYGVTPQLIKKMRSRMEIKIIKD